MNGSGVPLVKECICILGRLCWLAAVSLRGQSMTGDVRLHVEDPEALGVKAKVESRSDAKQYFTTQSTDEAGNLVAKRLPFGVYQVRVRVPGFATIV